MFVFPRERLPTFAVKRMTVAGALSDLEQDPGAGRDLTRDLEHLPPILPSGEGVGVETETGAEIEAETGAGTGAETEAETRVGTRVEVPAGVAPDPTLEVAENPDQGRGKSPGRDLGLEGPGLDLRGKSGGWLSLILQFLVDCIIWAFLRYTFVFFPAFFL